MQILHWQTSCAPICTAQLPQLKIGMDILLKEEHVAVDSWMGHGGFFQDSRGGTACHGKAGMNAPITVMDTASEGGAWGMAILAAFMKEKETGETLSSYLNDKIFAGQTGTTLQPEPEDVKGFEAFLKSTRDCFLRRRQPLPQNNFLVVKLCLHDTHLSEKLVGCRKK